MDTSQVSRQSGFTVIELIVVALVFTLAGFLIFMQVNKLNISNQDSQRKTAINAMYYALEEVYYKAHKSYPATLTSSTLPSVDPDLFTDPDGFTLGKDVLTSDEIQKLISKGDTTPNLENRLAALNTGGSPNYHYDATGCVARANCTGYTIRADLQSEAQYVKKNSSH